MSEASGAPGLSRIGLRGGLNRSPDHVTLPSAIRRAMFSGTPAGMIRAIGSSAVGDHDRLALTDPLDVAAEPVLQLAEPDGEHVAILARNGDTSRRHHPDRNGGPGLRVTATWPGPFQDRAGPADPGSGASAPRDRTKDISMRSRKGGLRKAETIPGSSLVSAAHVRLAQFRNMCGTDGAFLYAAFMPNCSFVLRTKA